MSTKSNIIAKIDGEYKWIYCHYNGYPKYVGNTLKKMYDEKATNWLFENGHVSELGYPFKIRNWNEDYYSESCLFYHSREDANTNSVTVTKEYLENLGNSFAEYFYFFDGVNWFCIIDVPNSNERAEKECKAIGLKTIKFQEVFKIIFD